MPTDATGKVVGYGYGEQICQRPSAWRLWFYIRFRHFMLKNGICWTTKWLDWTFILFCLMTNDDQISMHKCCLWCDISKQKITNSFQNKVKLAIYVVCCMCCFFGHLQFVLATWYRPFVLYTIKKFRVAFKHACIWIDWITQLPCD